MSLLLTLLAPPAHADRGALSIDLGGGVSGALLSPPTPPGYDVTSARATPTGSAATALGVRFALTNHLELSASAFYEPPVSVFHNAIVLQSSTPPVSAYPGTLADRYTRFGGLAGARWIWGSLWRLSLGAELGWARRTYGALVHYDDRDPSGAIAYRLQFRDVAVDSALVSAGAGLEWAFTDTLSVALLPRVQLLVGRDVVPAFTLPLVLSWSWYP